MKPIYKDTLVVKESSETMVRFRCMKISEKYIGTNYNFLFHNTAMYKFARLLFEQVLGQEGIFTEPTAHYGSHILSKGHGKHFTGVYMAIGDKSFMFNIYDN